MRIEGIDWDDANLEHATGHGVSADEIDQAILNANRIQLNKKRRTSTHIIHGQTLGGRRLLVFVVYDISTRLVRPITSWEEK